MEWWFRLFCEDETNETAAAAARRVSAERASIAASIVGRQAPVGQRGNSPANLRHASSANRGSPANRQQVIGNVNVESVGVEGDGDEVLLSPPPRGRRNGTQHRNGIIGSDVSSLSDPSSRF